MVCFMCYTVMCSLGEDDILMYLDKPDTAMLVILNRSGAFDTIDHDEILIKQMKQKNVVLNEMYLHSLNHT